MKNYAMWGLILLLSMSGFGSVMGQEPDPAEVKRRMEIYMRDDPAEAKKSAPAPKPRPRPPAVDHDREAWQSAEKCGTTACFEAYLEDYPKGRYAKMARARLNTEQVPSSAQPSLSSQAEAADLAAKARAEAIRRAAQADAARAEAVRAEAARRAAQADAARAEAATIELQSRPMTSMPARVPVIPTLPDSTSSGGSVVGSYALQENAYALRDYYRSQNVRAEAEKIMVSGRPMYQVRVWR